jgi:hypothetical protein
MDFMCGANDSALVLQGPALQVESHEFRPQSSPLPPHPHKLTVEDFVADLYL